MSIACSSTPAYQMQSQLSRFVTRNLDKPGTVWPRLYRPQLETNPPAVNAGQRALQVLVVGDLAVEINMTVKSTRLEMLTRLNRHGRKTIRWTELSVAGAGGFVGHAGRVAALLGANVSVCTTIPVPVPAPFETFLTRYVGGRSFVTAMPGCAARKIVLHCRDGQIVLEEPVRPASVAPDLPAVALTGIDAVLVDPGSFTNPGAVLSRLNRCLDGAEVSSVGVRLDHRCSGTGLAAVRDERVWSFMRRSEAQRLAARIDPHIPAGDEAAAAACLHDRLRIAKLVMQLGDRGALLLNGKPDPQFVDTCPVHAQGVGHGDTLLVVTALSSASGADDQTSLRRGVAAATGAAAGLELPCDLRELDA